LLSLAERVLARAERQIRGEAVTGGHLGGTVTDVPQADALLGLLSPAWQVLISLCLVVVLFLGLRRLARRGVSRMNTAVLVTAGLIIAVTALSTLSQLF
jgi:hypothetical protein